MKEVDNETSFRYWLKTAEPGEQVVYYSGFLMRDREVFLRSGGLLESFPPRIRSAIEAWRAYLNGTVKLTQKKQNGYDYQYIATKSKNP